jgi:hypothetical protein
MLFALAKALMDGGEGLDESADAGARKKNGGYPFPY